ncbi:metallophosphoesterase [bacterium]|nr:metallophosphoesterase [bacterium]
MTWVGSYWIGALFYGLLFLLVIDILKLSDFFLGWFPNWALLDIVQTKRIFLVSISVIIVLALTGGTIRARFPIVTETTITMNNFNQDLEEYNIAVISDLHLGTLVGESYLRKIIGMINDIDADAVMIIGDLVDEPPEKIGWAIEPLQEIESKDGVYFVSGNHEAYAGISKTLELIQQANITMLDDSLAQVGNAINLAGVGDRAGNSQSGFPFKPIKDILRSVDKALPVILMNHTPMRKSEAEKAGVDLMVCGHTHGGQIWPFGVFTKMIFKSAQGLSTFGKMNLFISNGIGTWGPPVRICAPPEIWHLTIKPKEDNGA